MADDALFDFLHMEIVGRITKTDPANPQDRVSLVIHF